MERNKEIAFFQTKVVGDSRSIATKNFVPGKLFAANYQKNILLPSVVQFVEWNTKPVIFSNEGCLGLETIVRQLPKFSIPVNIAADT